MFHWGDYSQHLPIIWRKWRFSDVMSRRFNICMLEKYFMCITILIGILTNVGYLNVGDATTHQILKMKVLHLAWK